MFSTVKSVNLYSKSKTPKQNKVYPTILHPIWRTQDEVRKRTSNTRKNGQPVPGWLVDSKLVLRPKNQNKLSTMLLQHCYNWTMV